MRIHIDNRRVHALAKELERAHHRAVPYATRKVLDEAAYATRKYWVDEIRSSFVLRDKRWTTGSLRVDRARGSVPAAMEARVGSIQRYMALQEHGGRRTGSGGSLAIPTSYAAGQGQGARPRTRKVRGRNLLEAITVRKAGSRPAGRRQANAAAMRVARAGTGWAYLAGARKRGLFWVGRGRGVKPKMTWDLSQGSARVRSTSTLGQALAKYRRNADRLHAKALAFALRKARAFVR